MQFIAIIIPILATIFTVGFVALWLRNRHQSHILGYIVGYLLLGVSYALHMLPGSMADPAIGVALHLIAMASVTAILWGAATRIGRKLPMVFLIGNTAASSALLYEAIIFGNANAIVVIQNGGSAVQFAIGATVLWTARPRCVLEKSVVWIVAAIAAVGLLRPAIALLAEGDLGGLIGGTSGFHGFQVIALTVLPMLLAMALSGQVLKDEWERSREAANSDALAGLRGRAALEQDVQSALDLARDTCTDVALIVGDIDHFRHINESWGHATGDLVIGNVGRLIARFIRTRDIAGRIEGQRFCVLVWDCNGQSAARLAERIRKSVCASDSDMGARQLSVTMSFGVAQLDAKESYHSLFDRARASLNLAKEQGRDQVFLEGHALKDADRRLDPPHFITVHG